MTDLSPDFAPVEDRQMLYPSEDAQAILQIAIAKKTEDGELSRFQLLEIAEELGISSETLGEAEQEWQLQKTEAADLKVFEQYRRQLFQSHLLRYSIINFVLMSINFLATAKLSWSLYIALFWGIAIALQALNTFRPDAYRYAEEFEKWRRRQQIKRSLNRFVDWLLGT